MAKKELVVTINGEETVTDATEKAGHSLTLFGKKIPFVLDATNLLAQGWNFARNAIGSVSERVMSALHAFDESEKAQRSLAGAAKILGVDHEYLNAIVATGKEKYKLSASMANEYAVQVAKLAKLSGNASSATELLGAFLDLGASQGMNAHDSLLALTQSINQVDDGTKKFFHAQPSSLWKEFGEAIGRNANKFSDMDKAAALAWAALRDGEKVGGEFAKYLESAAGKQDVLNQRLADAEVTLGKTLNPLRLMTLELAEKLLPALGPIARALGGVLGAVLLQVTAIFTDFWKVTVDVVGALAKLTGDKSVVEWSQRQSDATKAFREKLTEAGKAVENTIRGIDDTTKQSTAVAKVENTKRLELMKELEDAAKKRGDSEEDQLKKSEKAWKAYLKSVKDTQDMLRAAQLTNKEAADRLAKQTEKALNPVHLHSFNAAMKGVRESTDELWAAIKAGEQPTVSTVQKLESQIRLAGISLTDMARGTLDAAQAFGALDRDAAAVLNSVINVGSAVSKLLTSGSGALFAGVPAIVAGVGNIVTSMMQGDKERRELTQKNTEALNKLRTEGVRISNKASGEQIAGIAGALDPNLVRMLGTMTSEAARNAGNQILAGELAKAGLRLSDLDAVAGELGFNLRRSNGQIDLSQLPQFLQALTENMGQLTRIGQTFGEQLQFFRESQRLSGAGGMTQVADLIAFLRDAGGASVFGGIDLSDPTKARQALFDLFANLNNGGLGAGALGRLTGEQFQSAILDLIGLIDNLKDSSVGGSAGLGSVASVESTDIVSAGGLTLPMESLGQIIQITSNAQLTTLTAHSVLQDRIAVATEGSYGELQVQTGLLRDLITVCEGNLDRVNQALADARALANTNAGRGPSY